MKKIEIENVLNPRKPVTHIGIFLITMVLTLIIGYMGGFSTWNAYYGGFLLIFCQVEVFIILAHLIFRNVKPGKTPVETTRIVMFRFAFFLACCFLSAFVIILVNSYIRQMLVHGDLSAVIPDFLRYSFISWLKSTIGGLIFGTGIFIVVLWQDALKREQKLREENLIFQHETLKNQVNPHFLFNSLNTLSSLIASQPEIAEKFISRLSSIYRYILENSSKDSVPLDIELSFIKDYFYLHQIRDDEKILLDISISDPARYEILPASLQILVENAIKHNRATRREPLTISISSEGHQIIVKNNLQRMATQVRSTGIGLKNLSQRIKLMTGKDLVIEETSGFFLVKVPLLT